MEETKNTASVHYLVNPSLNSHHEKTEEREREEGLVCKKNLRMNILEY